ncbi:MAG TPA: hypothetical protein VFZ48_00635 [Candidatus Saccharimonadales bacterium]
MISAFAAEVEGALARIPAGLRGDAVLEALRKDPQLKPQLPPAKEEAYQKLREAITEIDDDDLGLDFAADLFG